MEDALLCGTNHHEASSPAAEAVLYDAAANVGGGSGRPTSNSCPGSVRAAEGRSEKGVFEAVRANAASLRAGLGVTLSSLIASERMLPCPKLKLQFLHFARSPSLALV